MLDKQVLNEVIVDRSMRDEIVRSWDMVEKSLGLACASARCDVDVLLNDRRIYRLANGHKAISDDPQLVYTVPFQPFGECLVEFYATDASPDATLKKNGAEFKIAVSMVQDVYRSQIDAHWKAMNLAHEMSSSLVGVSILCEQLDWELSDRSKLDEDWIHRIGSLSRDTLKEAQLGQYIVGNFLSNISSERYSGEYRDRPNSISLDSVVRQMCDLHRIRAEKKGIDIVIADSLNLPAAFLCNEYEIRRALHNALSNAIKYSFHQHGGVRRKIKVFSKNPYDPGFSKKRFALCLENYGIGISKDEMMHAFKSGYRGRQARAEVAVGSGIGLSEIRKIMRHHGGDARLRSEYLHMQASDETRVYKTTLELILPTRGSE